MIENRFVPHPNPLPEGEGEAGDHLVSSNGGLEICSEDSFRIRRTFDK